MVSNGLLCQWMEVGVVGKNDLARFRMGCSNAFDKWQRRTQWSGSWHQNWQHLEVCKREWPAVAMDKKTNSQWIVGPVNSSTNLQEKQGCQCRVIH